MNECTSGSTYCLSESVLVPQYYHSNFLSGMNPMISSRNCTIQQSSVNCRDQCVHRECDNTVCSNPWFVPFSACKCQCDHLRTCIGCVCVPMPACHPCDGTRPLCGPQGHTIIANYNAVIAQDGLTATRRRTRRSCPQGDLVASASGGCFFSPPIH